MYNLLIYLEGQQILNDVDANEVEMPFAEFPGKSFLNSFMAVWF